MMAMAVGANSMPADLPAMIAVLLIVIHDRMGGNRLRKAGGGVYSGREHEGGDDKRHRHDQSRP